jgi:hypothetical protein
MSDDHKHQKHLKKKLQQAKNRRTQIVFQHVELHTRERNLEREREEGLRDATKRSSARGAEAKKGEPAWSARMQEIRNKLDGKKRMAETRWNRFSGTADAGGMGR